MEFVSLSGEKLIIPLQVTNNPDEINYFFKNNYQNKIGIFVKLISKVFMTWKKWREFKSNESMNLREKDQSKIKTLSLNSRPEFRNFRMKSIVLMTREILRILSQYAVDYPTFPVNQCFFPLRPDPGGMLSRSLGMPSRNDRPPSIWDTHGIGKRFCKIHQRLLHHLIQEDTILGFLTQRNTYHSMYRVDANSQTQRWIRDASQDRQPEIHSTLVREDSQRRMGQTNKDCRFRIFILTNSLHQRRLLVGR